MKSDLNEWLTIREAADQLKVNEKTIRRMIKSDELPVFAKGRIRLLRRETITKITPRKKGQRRQMSA